MCHVFGADPPVYSKEPPAGETSAATQGPAAGATPHQQPPGWSAEAAAAAGVGTPLIVGGSDRSSEAGPNNSNGVPVSGGGMNHFQPWSGRAGGQVQHNPPQQGDAFAVANGAPQASGQPGSGNLGQPGATPPAAERPINDLVAAVEAKVKAAVRAFEDASGAGAAPGARKRRQIG